MRGPDFITTKNFCKCLNNRDRQNLSGKISGYIFLFNIGMATECFIKAQAFATKYDKSASDNIYSVNATCN